MSVDTAFADPTSPASPDGTPSAWDVLRMHLDAQRATQLAAYKQNAQPAPAPTAAELRARINQYNGWLNTLYVQNHGALANWVRQQKANALRQLAELTAGGAK